MSDSDGDGPEDFKWVPEEDAAFENYYASKPEDVKNDDVIEESVDPADAFARFVGTYYDTTNSDFSGKISKTTAPKIVTVFKPNPPNEPPLVKYNRLDSELKQLKEELEAKKISGIAAEAAVLIKKASSASSSLKSYRVSKKFTPFLNPHYPVKEEHLHVKGALASLKKQVKEIQNKKSEESKEDEVKGICYELWQAKPAKSKTATSISSLEKRLNNLEATIGSSQLQIFPDIRSTIIYIGKKLEKLDGKQLSSLQSKMDYLSRELKHLEKQKDKLASAKKTEYQKKVKELYNLMPEWDRSAAALPIIRQRLETIKALVVAGAKSDQQLSKVTDTKNEVSILLDKNSSLLKKVQNKFKNDLKEVKVVCDLEKDFEELTKKMQQHFG